MHKAYSCSILKSYVTKWHIKYYSVFNEGTDRCHLHFEGVVPNKDNIYNKTINHCSPAFLEKILDSSKIPARLNTDKIIPLLKSVI